MDEWDGEIDYGQDPRVPVGTVVATVLLITAVLALALWLFSV